ncbi:uncharacterized protein LOC112346522 isoform X1 [Selaginella moellendorffii]|uniref:uncharacterized protein LOC112346522 isoform X1 n=1 Tax=Selaginella moellendorffii TaxID=88036 RepID=UPI000D1C9184|nr:uncharacterized protein LOC112346522 isoform X1 [Selaginella moellendorffii]|eukprot:XP_024531422.1 uncharacterized protein LOC112346522 isoform X1 [Selaginella moellendorffii]
MLAMSAYESSWGQGWDAAAGAAAREGDVDFEGFGVSEPAAELNVIEFLDSLEDVERVSSCVATAAAAAAPSENHPQAPRDNSGSLESYAFNAAAYDLTIKCLDSGSKPSEGQIKKADPSFPEKRRNNRAVADALLSRWKSLSSALVVMDVESDGIKRRRLSSKWDKFRRIIAYREEWPFVVDKFHVEAGSGSCLNLRDTVKNLGLFYVTGNKKHGIPEDFIKARIGECPKCDDQLHESPASKRLRKNLPERWPEVHTVPWQHLDDFIEGLCIRHRVSLRKESTYMIASPEPSIVTTWVCARGFRKQEGADSSSKNVGATHQGLPCTFRVRTLIPVRISQLPELNPEFPEPVNLPERTASVDPSEDLLGSKSSSQLPDFQDGHGSYFEQMQANSHFLDSSNILVTVLLNRAHRGHNPNDKEDYVNFPVHSSAKEAALYEFDLSWDVISVARASLRMDMLLKSRATDLDKATFRFRLIPKEVAQLTMELNSQGKISSSDWVRLLKEVDAHRKKKTVIFYQQYDVFNPVEEKQPFVCVIMTPWMREMAERFSAGNVWALDSTFTTCIRGLPLHAAAVPNQDGIGMPVFFMMCSADTGSRHESIALKLALTAVFKQLSVRPAAILIDKSRLSFDALFSVVSRDEKCWRDGKQIACRLLLCWFCVKRAWVENLLPQVASEMRKDVYRQLDGMMMAPSEADFDNLWNKFKEDYGGFKEIVDYLEMGWLGSHCAWRRIWPTFGRLFEHGNVETINIVSYLWLFIKYSLFGGRMNQSNCDLLLALVGSALTSSKPEGGTLEEFFRQRQVLCIHQSFPFFRVLNTFSGDSRRYHSQSSTSAERKRLAAAERFLAQYNNNRACFEVLSEPGFLFRVHSCNGDTAKSHVVNLLTNFCDCLETMFTCEHLLAARLVVRHNFVSMYGLLERRSKERDEPLTQVEDIDLAYLDESCEDHPRATGLSCELDGERTGGSSEWDSLVQEIAHVQMQLSNLQAYCEDQLIEPPAELSLLLSSQLKSLRAFTGAEGSSKTEITGDSRVGIIQEHLKACKLQPVKCCVQLKKAPSLPAQNPQQRGASYAHAQTLVHPRLGYVHYYKQLKPAKINRLKCVSCGVYNVVGGSFEVTECKNCSRYFIL